MVAWEEEAVWYTEEIERQRDIFWRYRGEENAVVARREEEAYYMKWLYDEWRGEVVRRYSGDLYMRGVSREVWERKREMWEKLKAMMGG